MLFTIRESSSMTSRSCTIPACPRTIAPACTLLPPKDAEPYTFDRGVVRNFDEVPVIDFEVVFEYVSGPALSHFVVTVVTVCCGQQSWVVELGWALPL